MPRISLVIPAFNEEHYLPQLLKSIALARQRYELGADEIEVIVADNASTDRTAEIARASGCCVVRVEKRAIAAARNGGAGVATGQILAFVDADSQIHPDTFNAIERTLASDRVVVGATSVRYDRMSPGIAFTTFAAVTLFQVTGLDAGVVFCRLADWQAVGGYNEDQLWFADAQFLMALKRLGRTRGQGFARAKGARAITSSRKYDRLGDWHVFTNLLPCGLAGLLFNRPAFGRLVRSYWYGDRGDDIDSRRGSRG
jgi:glycosyltransferase involved in cell wall biosynthesis